MKSIKLRYKAAVIFLLSLSGLIAWTHGFGANFNPALGIIQASPIKVEMEVIALGDLVAAQTFTADAGTDILTTVPQVGVDKYTTGLPLKLITAGVLPAPLLVATQYYVIRLSSTTFKLAASSLDATNNIPIDILDAGTGVHTADPEVIDLNGPTAGGAAQGIPNVLFVATQNGEIFAINLVTKQKALFFNLSQKLVDMGAAAAIPYVGGMVNIGTLFPAVTGIGYDERGLTGMVFHPNFATNGLFYTSTSEIHPANLSGSRLVAPNNWNRVREWYVPPAGRTDPTLSVIANINKPEPSKMVLEVAHDSWNHNMNSLFFGRKAADSQLMYIAVGDGGCADDQSAGGFASICPNKSIQGNAQDSTKLFGKILRLDPATATGAFNPSMIYAKGLRNPYGASVDSLNGDIWSVDVGQEAMEEVNARIQLGDNLGWRIKEGSFDFNAGASVIVAGFTSDGTVSPATDHSPLILKDPLVEYDHDDGHSSIGGYVYRGSNPLLADLVGKYIFAEWGQGPSRFVTNGRLFVVENGAAQVRYTSNFNADDLNSCDVRAASEVSKLVSNGFACEVTAGD